jgi:hypothetical protein
MMRFSTEFRGLLLSPVTLVAWGALSLCCALSGPFGSYGVFDLPTRMALWGVTLAKAFVIALALRCAAHALLHRHSRQVRTLASVVLIVPFVALPVHAVTQHMAEGVGLPGPGLVEIVLFTIVVTLTMSLLRHLSDRAGLRAAARLARAGGGMTGGGMAGGGMAGGGAVGGMAAGGPARPRVPPRLLTRLPEPLRAPLVRISVSDHRVEVQTEAGTACLLMRFANALGELGETEGLRIHQSHWVATRAVAALVPDGAGLAVMLRDGRRLPVSRPNQAAARAAFGRRQV